jgi:hypothetical protein
VSATFIAPYRDEDRLPDAGRDTKTGAARALDPPAGYDAFLADIVSVAQRFGFEPKPRPVSVSRACADCDNNVHSLTAS